MNNPEDSLPIAAVERDTSIAKDTLRVWEKRYGFPQPHRDANGERLYPREQIERLRLIKRLLDRGHRPGKVVPADDLTLQTWLDNAPTTARATDDDSDDTLRELLAMVAMHRSDELNQALQRQLMRQGLQRFANDTIAPLARLVGDGWMRGELDVAEEHLFTEHAQNVLRNAIAGVQGTGRRPAMLLTTFPEEEHSLGLLMASAVLTPEGVRCVSLGTCTPLPDIANAALAGGFDVVGLSFSPAYPLRQAHSGLKELLAMLPPGVEIWAGGRALAAKPPRLERVHCIGDLATTLTVLQDWRDRHSD